MKKSSYLKAISVFELIGYIAGIVLYIILFFAGFAELTLLYQIGIIVSFILFLFLGPAMFVLFGCVAELYGDKENAVHTFDTKARLVHDCHIKDKNVIIPKDTIVFIAKFDGDRATVVAKVEGKEYRIVCPKDYLVKI